MRVCVLAVGVRVCALVCVSVCARGMVVVPARHVASEGDKTCDGG
jgi:hypothetical protein